MLSVGKNARTPTGRLSRGPSVRRWLTPSHGTIYNIQRFSVDDGPGIRTTVFFKGCPLRCWWCCNPESQSFSRQVMHREEHCTRCGACAKACGHGAIQVAEHRTVDPARCRAHTACAGVCPQQALRPVGRIMTSEDVMAVIRKDLSFYRHSGGGVTLSGGEPLSQPAFAHAVLRKSKRLGLHTALDTCGFADWTVVEPLLEHLDLVLFDVKHTDAAAHRRGTGVSNRRILENLQRLRQAKRAVELWLRVPLIPGFNDDEAALSGLVELVHQLGIETVFLLPYHPWGAGKYERLNRRYALEHLEPMSLSQLAQIERWLHERGVSVRGLGRSAEVTV